MKKTWSRKSRVRLPLRSGMVCSSQLSWGLAPVLLKRWHVGMFFSISFRTGPCPAQEMACWGLVWCVGLFFSFRLRIGPCPAQEMTCWGLVGYVSSQLGWGLAPVLLKRWYVEVWYGMFFAIRLRTGICQEMACWGLVWYVLLNEIEDFHLSIASWGLVWYVLLN